LESSCCRSHAGAKNPRWRPRLTPSADGATEDYIYGPTSQPVEQIALSTSTPTYLTYTPSDSSWLASNEPGDQTGYWRYDAYGTPTTGGIITASTSPFGYSGQYLDATTGFCNDRARWHQPQDAGFTSRDPALDLTDTAYTYATGDPVNKVDPSGAIVNFHVAYIWSFTDFANWADDVVHDVTVPFTPIYANDSAMVVIFSVRGGWVSATAGAKGFKTVGWTDWHDLRAILPMPPAESGVFNLGSMRNVIGCPALLKFNTHYTVQAAPWSAVSVFIGFYEFY
jgi:RHS repeat-associated protein